MKYGAYCGICEKPIDVKEGYYCKRCEKRRIKNK